MRAGRALHRDRCLVALKLAAGFADGAWLEDRATEVGARHPSATLVDSEARAGGLAVELLLGVPAYLTALRVLDKAWTTKGDRLIEILFLRFRIFISFSTRLQICNLTDGLGLGKARKNKRTQD